MSAREPTFPPTAASARKPTPGPRDIHVDELALAIVRHLRDGRKSFREIAAALGVTENTVRARVRRMERAGILEITGTVDPYTVPNHFLVLVGVKLKTVRLVEKAEEFGRLRGVVSVAVVTGQYDLILTVLLNDELTIKRFYTEEVAKIPDIQSTETWVVYHHVRGRVPYVL
ncbi:Lrp/AsnC family transcriptional regulator [Deferrisoma camini]|uniref:Lrp/AsnC family transcriptional regulator n=1 Tax=Deferrisoma camini TaxID=1035120 RepID=UPI0004B8F359|nr:Lrp/AsnC family transcriptional regulator [Deferrisoma camini]